MRNALMLFSLVLLGACSSQDAIQDHFIDGNSLPSNSAVNYLTQQIANELVRQNDQLTSKQALLVATPVLLDDLTTTNPLGLQIQQGLITAMHDHQFNLVDLNVGENVSVTNEGELLLTRDWRKLPADLPVEHVLVSTMSLSMDMLVVNSRIVNVTNNRVVSAAASSVGVAQLPGYLRMAEKVTSKDGKLHRNSQPGQADIQIIGANQ
ncbi:FlgO family outer membrane protein [Shewanella colwelliana]|uniref:FlgO family outer membrane protein n=1 Tax=Shewanella colwelliana TaxID=23 RepID=UPI00048F9CBD|nr:FlgO family outer membrane protein [Shewanella colwelliana]